MATIISKVKLYIIYWFAVLSASVFFFSWFCNAVDDLLRDVFQPTSNKGNIINLWENVNTVWDKVVKWPTEVWTEWVSSGNSVILKVTRLILILTVALSVTMILYNGMTYIIATWQWKEWKGLIKNVLLIVVGIFVALFSVVIINLIQSIPVTIDEELESDIKHEEDMEALKGKKMSWKEVWQSISDIWKSIWHKKDKQDDNTEPDEDKDKKSTEDIDLEQVVKELEDACKHMWGKFSLGSTTETESTYNCELDDGTIIPTTIPNKKDNS